MAATSNASAASILNSVLENIKNLPSSDSVFSTTSASASGHGLHRSSSVSTSSAPIFDRAPSRKRPLHDLLGGGHSADVLLWRKKHISAGFLAASTAVWVLFEWIGYHFVSLLSLILLVFVVVLFAWSNGSSFLNRAPPPIPTFQVSDELVMKVANTLTAEINNLLAAVRDIATGSDVPRFCKLVGVLSLLVIMGSWFNFVTLFYLAIVAAHTLPVLYEKNEETIDRLLDRAWIELSGQIKKVDSSLLSKISAVQKKNE